MHTPCASPPSVSIACRPAWTSASGPGPFGATQYPPTLTNGRHSSASVRTSATARAVATSNRSRYATSFPASSARLYRCRVSERMKQNRQKTQTKKNPTRHLKHKHEHETRNTKHHTKHETHLHRTSTFPSPMASAAAVLNVHRLLSESRSVTLHSGRSAANISPGRPAPLPTSTIRPRPPSPPARERATARSIAGSTARESSMCRDMAEGRSLIAVKFILLFHSSRMSRYASIFPRATGSSWS